MSPSDPKSGQPSVSELTLTPLTASLPRTTETPNYPAAATTSTPGLALAAARVPGGPTLPELDPLSLTNVISQLANHLYAAPPPPANAVPATADTSAFSSPPFAAATPSAPSTAQAQLPAGAPSGLPDAPVTAQTAALGSPSISNSAVVPASAAPAGGAGSPSYATPAATPGAAPSFASTGPTPSFGAPTHATPAEAPSYASRAGAPASRSAPFDEPLKFDSVVGPVDWAPGVSGDDLMRFPLQDAEAPAAPAPARVEEPRFALDLFQIDHALPSGGRSFFDPNVIRNEFPILHEPVRGKRLVWLDNGATTQKPKAVIDRLSYFYEHENSNIHRAAHTLAGKATDAYEGARETVRRFINAPAQKDIVFVRGTTEGINFIAKSWGKRNVSEGDEILITWLEHHANIVPWQQLCSETGAKLRVAPVDNRGQVLLDEYEKLLNPRTKLVSFTHVSNALGTITPAREMIEMAHRHGAIALLDGAQSISHMPVDVQALGCDFYVFSGHKVFAPTGIGAVFGRSELLEHMPPWQGGGNMIQDVTFEKTTFQGAPARFEAGTGNIADAVGLGAALDWLSRVGVHNVERYEHELLEYGTARLRTVPGLTMIGTAPQKAGVLSFVLAGQKTEEVGGILDQEGIAVRSGHHCAQPILRRFGVEATVRASLAPYNTYEDIDALVAALHRLQSGRR